jgi:hypothetical protein
MSARITVILYILVYFELGGVLVISPWTSYWNDNLFLAYLVQHVGSPHVMLTMNSVWIRGAVSALGAINILLGIVEAFRYRDLLRLIQEGKGGVPSVAPSGVSDEPKNDEAQSEPAVAVSDNRPDRL